MTVELLLNSLPFWLMYVRSHTQKSQDVVRIEIQNNKKNKKDEVSQWISYLVEYLKEKTLPSKFIFPYLSPEVESD